MRILVTGADGYIGAVLTPMLEERGDEVIALDSGLFSGCSIGHVPHARSKSPLDIREVEAHHLEGVDAICHLAALSNDPLGALSEHATVDINQRGTMQLAHAAREAGVKRFVFSSTCSVYGAQGGDCAVETSATSPITAYAATKVAAETQLLAMASESFETICLRNATAYGFSPRLRLDLVVNYFTAGAASMGKLLVRSDGLAWRPLVHIQDISRAFLAVLDSPAAAVTGQVFNVGSLQENYQVRDLTDIVRRVFPDCAVEYAADAGPDARSYRIDATKIEKAIGFKLEWTVENGVHEMKQAFQRYGLRPEDLDGPRFHRMPKLKALLNSGLVDQNMRIRPAAFAEV